MRNICINNVDLLIISDHSIPSRDLSIISDGLFVGCGI